MRLTEKQVKLLIAAFDDYMVGHTGELRLYGSRVDDSLKGGDIDLLLLVNDADLSAALTSQKHHVLANVKKHIGDQRIDLKIAVKDEVVTDPFLTNILPTSEIINTW